MEVCQHGDLSSQITHKTIDTTLRHAWIDQLLLGLQHMHNLNVIHRDIKTVRRYFQYYAYERIGVSPALCVHRTTF